MTRSFESYAISDGGPTQEDVDNAKEVLPKITDPEDRRIMELYIKHAQLAVNERTKSS